MVRDSIEAVRAWLRDPSNSKRELATEAGIHENVLRKVDDPDWMPSGRVLVALEDAIARLKKPSAPEA